ncbi:DUF998 domain-containing protein [Glycomyces terrestris]|uniref:DUF998 domain-containing protein n=1 Tax=Glycomyces terrestris TaxID=2493553 RepID=A0A426URJ4_9ACTN|nr:DUF998 domain-containing protein [Glycomyces terrestris]RRR95792.1 DUF998 domain-containing protein [Glycomyces terrestris]
MFQDFFRSRAAGVAAMAGVAASQAGFAAMHVTQSDVVDPVAIPVSAYAVTWPGVVLFPASVLALAAACAVLAGRGVGLAREGFVRFLLGATAAMLVCAAVFRTGTPESGLTWWAQIHRYTAGAAFVLLSVVAVVCAVRMRQAGAPAWVRHGTWWAAALAGLTFATTTVNTFLPGFLDGGDWRGVPQRVLLVVLSTLLWFLVANSIRALVPAEAAAGGGALVGGSAAAGAEVAAAAATDAAVADAVPVAAVAGESVPVPAGVPAGPLAHAAAGPVPDATRALAGVRP